MRIAITDVTGREVRSIDGTKNAGLNRVQWDLAPTAPAGRGRGAAAAAVLAAAVAAAARGGQPAAVPAGSYLVKLTVGDKVIGQKTVVVEPDSTFMQQ